MQEIKLKSHLIITDIHNEFFMNWCGKLLNCNPLLDENGLPTFIIIGSKGRVETHTPDMKYLEDCAKRLTEPKGREAITSDSARIYIKKNNGDNSLLGVLFHKKIKTFAPMYDDFLTF